MGRLRIVDHLLIWILIVAGMLLWRDRVNHQARKVLATQPAYHLDQLFVGRNLHQANGQPGGECLDYEDFVARSKFASETFISRNWAYIYQNGHLYSTHLDIAAPAQHYQEVIHMIDEQGRLKILWHLEPTQFLLRSTLGTSFIFCLIVSFLLSGGSGYRKWRKCREPS